MENGDLGIFLSNLLPLISIGQRRFMVRFFVFFVSNYFADIVRYIYEGVDDVDQLTFRQRASALKL